MFQYIHALILGYNKYNIISELVKRNMFTDVALYLSYSDKVHLSQVNNEYHEIILKIINKYKKHIDIVSKMHPECIDIFGVDNLVTYQIYTNVDSIVGHTGYIDKIDPSLVQDTFMIGIDNLKRPFIVIKFSCNGKQHINCFFQRYSNTIKEWACSSNNHVRINAEHGYIITNGKLVHNVLKQNIQNVQQNMKWIYQYDFWKEAPDNLFKLNIE